MNEGAMARVGPQRHRGKKKREKRKERRKKHAMNAQRGSRGIALLSLQPQREIGVCGQLLDPVDFFRGKKPVIRCTESWVGLKASLDGRGKSRPHKVSISGPSIP